MIVHTFGSHSHIDTRMANTHEWKTSDYYHYNLRCVSVSHNDSDLCGRSIYSGTRLNRRCLHKTTCTRPLTHTLCVTSSCFCQQPHHKTTSWRENGFSSPGETTEFPTSSTRLENTMRITENSVKFSKLINTVVKCSSICIMTEHTSNDIELIARWSMNHQQ